MTVAVLNDFVLYTRTHLFFCLSSDNLRLAMIISRFTILAIFLGIRQLQINKQTHELSMHIGVFNMSVAARIALFFVCVNTL